MSKSVILNRELQFVAELMKELNEMLRIKTKLLTAFYLQTDRQTERTNQELEQYLRIYTATKSSPFKVNYERELRIGFEIYIDRNRKKAVEYKVEDKVLLSTKNLTWQIRNKEMRKLTEKLMGPYKIKKIISENIVELELLVSMKIYLVIDVSRIAIYQEQVEG